MNRIFLFLLFFSGTFYCYSQGMLFYSGSWEEVLDKAKEENKLIFVDVYTDWCAPCKKMAKSTFTHEEVGTYYNTSFINYKVNAEEGEGIALAEHWGVRAYPFLLYADSEGHIINYVVGFQSPAVFLESGMSTINFYDRIDQLDSLTSKNDLEILLFRSAGVNSEWRQELSERYWSLLNEEEKGEKRQIKYLEDNLTNVSLEMLEFYVHHGDYKGLDMNKMHRCLEMDNRLQKEMRQTIADEDIERLNYLLELREEIWRGQIHASQKIYNANRDYETALLDIYKYHPTYTKEYGDLAEEMINKYFLILTVEEVNRQDGFVDSLLSNPAKNNSTAYNSPSSEQTSPAANKIVKRLNDIGYQFWIKYEDRERLMKVLSWMDYSLELMRNPESYLIKAGIANKLGEHDEARKYIALAEPLSGFEIKKRKYQSLLHAYQK